MSSAQLAADVTYVGNINHNEYQHKPSDVWTMLNKLKGLEITLHIKRKNIKNYMFHICIDTYKIMMVRK